MIRDVRARWRWRTAALGFACGAAAGMTLLTGSVIGANAGEPAAIAPAGVERGLRDVLHTPPLLAADRGPVELRYEAICQADGAGTPCALTGTLFVRVGDAPFRPVRLAQDGESALSASVDVPGQGISYYAVIEDRAGNVMTIPSAGGAAPHRAWAVPEPETVSLGTHVFGRVRKPDGRRAAAGWGGGEGAFGLIAGREVARIGPSAFDIAPDGTLVVLDQVNDRLALYPATGGPPRYVPVAFRGAEGDVASGPDGYAYVLDQGVDPVVRAYTAAGDLVATTAVGGSGADMLRTGPGGVVVHGYPGDVWWPLGGARSLLQPSQQAVGATPGRMLEGGSQVLVHAERTNALFALVRGDRVVRAWRVTSRTSLGEVQLAEPFGDGLLVVMRLWTSQRAEFAVLHLSPAGLAASFAVDAVEWAESTALGRFRVSGRTLYQLRSAAAGVEIVTFDLGGAQ